MSYLEKNLKNIKISILCKLTVFHGGMEDKMNAHFFCCVLLLFILLFSHVIGINIYLLMLLQEKWAKNLYIASICYGRTVC